MKTVLITGANSGIGLATAKLFLEKGYFVFAHYHSSSEALRSLTYKNLKIIQADFCNLWEIDTLIAECQKYSNVDILVNNAGDYIVQDSLHDVSVADMEFAYKVNCIAPFLLIKGLIENMRENRWGRVINLSSVGAVKYGGSIEAIAYSASKAALESIALTFSKYAVKDNVLINTIRGGVVNTDFHAKNKNKDMNKRIEMIPIGRMAEAREIANIILFLASEDCTFVSGSIIPAGGGE